MPAGCGPAKGDTQIQAVGQQIGLDAVLRRLAHREGDTWMRAAESMYQWPNEICGKRRCHGDAQMPARQIVHIVHGAFAGVQIAQGQARVLGVRLAGVGQSNGATRTIEQDDSERAFELLDLLGKRRLRDVQRLGRAGEIGVIGYREEIPDMTQFHQCDYRSL